MKKEWESVFVILCAMFSQQNMWWLKKKTIMAAACSSGYAANMWNCQASWRHLWSASFISAEYFCCILLCVCVWPWCILFCIFEQSVCKCCCWCFSHWLQNAQRCSVLVKISVVTVIVHMHWVQVTCLSSVVDDSAKQYLPFMLDHNAATQKC